MSIEAIDPINRGGESGQAAKVYFDSMLRLLAIRTAPTEKPEETSLEVLPNPEAKPPPEGEDSEQGQLDKTG